VKKMANGKRKRSRKENKAIHAKKRKQFDIWTYQETGERKERKGGQKRLNWASKEAETKKARKRGAFLPEF